MKNSPAALTVEVQESRIRKLESQVDHLLRIVTRHDADAKEGRAIRLELMHRLRRAHKVIEQLADLRGPEIPRTELRKE